MWRHWRRGAVFPKASGFLRLTGLSPRGFSGLTGLWPEGCGGRLWRQYKGGAAGTAGWADCVGRLCRRGRRPYGPRVVVAAYAANIKKGARLRRRLCRRVVERDCRKRFLRLTSLRLRGLWWPLRGIIKIHRRSAAIPSPLNLLNPLNPLNPAAQRPPFRPFLASPQVLCYT